MAEQETVIAFGSELKSLGGGKYGGLLVRFTPKGDYDLTGDRFDAETDFGFKAGETKKAHVWLHHAQPIKVGKRQLHVKDEIGDAELTIVAEGVAIIAQARKEYQELVSKSAKDMGWSSGTANHLVEREPEGKGYHITRWLLGDDASLTPTPAEHRNQVVALKSLTVELPEADTENAASVVSAAKPDGDADKQGEKEMDEKEIKALADASAAQVKMIEEQGKQIKELGTTVAEATKTLGAVVEALKKEPPKGSGIQVTHAEEDTSYKAICPHAPFGKFMQEIRTYAMQGTVTPQLKAIVGANESIPSEGGFLVPTEQAGVIEKKMFDESILAQRCDTKQLSVGNSVDFYGRDEDSRANGSRYGGVTAYRVAEAGQITVSSVIKQWKYTLKPKEYAALYVATNDVLQDAPLLESEIMEAVPSELAFLIDDDIFEGLGAAGCLGFTNSAALISVTRTTTSHFEYKDVVNMWARMWARSWPNAVWFVNQDTTPDILTMTLGTGTAYTPVYLPPGGASAAPYGTIFGRPVIPLEYCASLGTVGDVILADMSQYKVATKGDLQTAQSMHVYFDTNQMAYRFIKRVDGQPKWRNALTPFKGTGNTQSPFIAVAS